MSCFARRGERFHPREGALSTAGFQELLDFRRLPEGPVSGQRFVNPGSRGDPLLDGRRAAGGGTCPDLPPGVLDVRDNLPDGLVEGRALRANFFRAAVYGFRYAPEGTDPAGVPGREQQGQPSATRLPDLPAETA